MQPQKEKLEPKPVADWTIMVYLAGDNNLSADCVTALTEMSKAIDTPMINVIAQYDSSNEYIPAKRFELSKSALRVNGNGNGNGAGHRVNGASHNGAGSLAQYVLDVAMHNPRTGEIHFHNESRAANVLADLRLRDREEQLKHFVQEFNDHQRFNATELDDQTYRSRTDTNSASPITLYNFLSFGIEFYPARHYLVILSGHSAGIMPRYLLRDEGAGRYMTLRQLQFVLDNLGSDLEMSARQGDGRAGKIDIFGFDTCLMAMAEICYELKECRVDTIIGSQSYIPTSGWPYSLLLRTFNQLQATSDAGSGGDLSSEQVAQEIVKSYVDFYKDYLVAGVSSTLSALKVNKIERLRELIDDLATVLMAELSSEHAGGTKDEKPFTDALILAHWETQSYNGELYVDLVDFCECLGRRYPNRGVSEACQSVVQFVKDHVVIESSASGAAYQYSNGCAIYFPWAEVGDYFWDLDFGRDSKWGHFLEMYTNLTRRKYRVPANPTLEQLKQIEFIETVGGNLFFHESSSTMLSSHRMGSDKMASERMSSENKHGIEDKHGIENKMGVENKMGTVNKMGSDRMGSDKMGSENKHGIENKMGSDRMGSDKMASDKMGSDRMISDRMAADRMVSGRQSSGKMGSENKMGSDKMMSDRMADVRMGSENKMGPENKQGIENKMGSDRMGSDKMASDKMGSDRMGSDKMGPENKMGSDKMASDKMISDWMAVDRMGPDKMGSNVSRNPIHSMRNPPIVAIDLD